VARDAFPTLRRWLRQLDGFGIALLPVVVVSLGAMYSAVGDALTFFGEPADPSAVPRSIAAGVVLLTVAAGYAWRRHPILATLLVPSAALPPLLVIALPDTAYDLLAIWTLGPIALGSAILACGRRRQPTTARTTASATMTSPPRER
jgi:hypothetical protein